MIKWEEFEHIHVVKRIQGILGHWFSTDVFIVDEQNHIQNAHRGDKKIWNNPLMNQLLAREQGWGHFEAKLREANQHLAHNDVPRFEFEFFPGVWAIAYPIIFEREFFGSVVGLCFRKDEKKEPTREYINQMKNCGLPEAESTKDFWQVKCVKSSDQQYFMELVDLIGQEILTLHKEITVRENRIKELNSELGSRHSYTSMIGKSKPIQDVYSLLDKIANTESTVLVQGDNGTGKELIAKAIHYNSQRKDKSFLALNCAAFNDNLLESELFGHVKGSFTGAIRDRKGYFETAHGGTLFLDEIGDISQAMQVKLLRVLQDGTFTPVGATEQRKVNVRIIAATNRNLKQMVEAGTFRQDLYFRLNVIGVQVPALRDRKEDIPLLVDHFLAKAAKEKNIPPRTMSKRAMQKLFDYHWPGNIRELENEMERVTVLAGDEIVISPEMLSPRIRETEEKPKIQGARLSGKLKDALEELERTMIREGLRRTNWNKSQLAKELGISRAGLIMKVEKYGLDKRKGMLPGRTGSDF